jgi:twitching motility protein PilT
MDPSGPATNLIKDLLETMVSSNASDLFIAPNSAAMFRIDGELVSISQETSISREDLEIALKNFAPSKNWMAAQNDGQTTFALSIDERQRVRVSYNKTLDGLSASFRLLATEALTVEEAGLPEALLDTLWAKNGLMIVTGPAGSGTTTLLASIVDTFNRMRNDRILCLEDPVEIVHEHKNSLVVQYDVRQSGGFSAALTHARRERPDIIVISDLLEAALIEPVLELAGSGTLVIAGMPFRASAPALAYLIESLPRSRRERACAMLSYHLHWVLAQTLVNPSRGQGRFAARELLICDELTRTVIKKGLFAELPTVMRSSAQPGMVEFNQALTRLVQANDIKSTEAYRVAADQNRLAFDFRRSGIELGGLSALEKSILEHATAPKPTRESVRVAGGPDQSGSRSRSGSVQRGWF